MGLRGGDRDLIQRRFGRAQTVSLHQDIGDTRRFEQHAPFRDDNQECMHGDNKKNEQNRTDSHCIRKAPPVHPAGIKKPAGKRRRANKALPSSLRQIHPAGARQLRQQRRLKRLVVYRRVGIEPLLMVPIAAGRQGLRLIAGHQPRLRHMPQRQIVGRIRAAHFGRHPAGIDCAADHVRPQARHGGGQRGDEQLAVRIGTAAPPSQSTPFSSGTPSKCILLLR